LSELYPFGNILDDRIRAFAFLASPNYTLLEGYSQNTPVRVYVLREHEALAPTVLNTAVQALNLFRNRFGPYPHEELIIAENGFLTAMEYSAIISLSGFAFNEYNNSFRSLLTPITAHEVAHQWWYSAVGNDQVLEPWLDEALCMFAELIYYETYHPNDVEWWWQYRVHRWNPTGYVDATIYDYNNSPDFVHDLYSQSAYFLRDLRAQMGAANFNNFLRAYYQRYRNQTVTTNDFFTLAQDYTTADLRPLVSRYFTTLPAALSSP
jgi:aminopeptidase N